MPDPSQIDALRARFHARLTSLASEADIRALHDELLGRKSGAVTALTKTLGTLPPDERRAFGALANALKTEIETALEEARTRIREHSLPAGAVDVTLPARTPPIGRIHPLARVRQQVEDIFTRMG